MKGIMVIMIMMMLNSFIIISSSIINQRSTTTGEKTSNSTGEEDIEDDLEEVYLNENGIDEEKYPNRHNPMNPNINHIHNPMINHNQMPNHNTMTNWPSSCEHWCFVPFYAGPVCCDRAATRGPKCPAIRATCTYPDRSFVNQPRYCFDHNQCGRNELCCYDKCLNKLVCKPAKYD